jgi:hypothetical protein
VFLATVLGAVIPVLSASGATASEGDPAVFLVRLSKTSRKPVTVRFRTVADTAVAGADYTSRSGTLRFAPGQRAQRIRIATVDDADVEADELFGVVFTRAIGARLRTPRVTGRIARSDVPAPFTLRADLSGTDEVPGFVSASGRGTTSITFDPLKEQVAYEVSVTGMEPALAGICRGPPRDFTSDVRQFEGRFVAGQLTGSVQLALAKILEIYRAPEDFCARVKDTGEEFIRGYLRRA